MVLKKARSGIGECRTGENCNFKWLGNISLRRGYLSKVLNKVREKLWIAGRAVF